MDSSKNYFRRNPVTLAVLAGGKSTRMGIDKSSILFSGQLLLERVISRLDPLMGEVIISVGMHNTLAMDNVRIIKDNIVDGGPIIGLLNCLNDAAFPLVAVAACDMPFVNRSLFERLIQTAEENQVDAVIPESKNGLEPFHAVYRKESCLLTIVPYLETGNRSLKKWLSQINLHVFDLEKVKRIDPTCLMFTNLNTQDQLRQAEKLVPLLG